MAMIGGMTITRIGPSRYSRTRSRIVIHEGVATTAVVSPDKSPSLYVQAREALAVLDQHLAEAGTHKSRLLMVMIYLTDIGGKAEFNRAWDEWVDRENLPLRACVGSALEGDDLVELVATAAIHSR
jgi:enamine deaminase RidA (YjgF/YER057c/UK114 family)